MTPNTTLHVGLHRFGVDARHAQQEFEPPVIGPGREQMALGSDHEPLKLRESAFLKSLFGGHDEGV